MIRRMRAQSTVEYAFLFIIMAGALIAMQIYIKRGFQGRWKSSVDDIGEQYDPGAVNSWVNYSMISQSNSAVTAVPAMDPVTGQLGYFTNRVDTTISNETKQGYTTIAPP